MVCAGNTGEEGGQERWDEEHAQSDTGFLACYFVLGFAGRRALRLWLVSAVEGAEARREVDDCRSPA